MKAKKLRRHRTASWPVPKGSELGPGRRQLLSALEQSLFCFLSVGFVLLSADTLSSHYLWQLRPLKLTQSLN